MNIIPIAILTTIILKESLSRLLKVKGEVIYKLILGVALSLVLFLKINLFKMQEIRGFEVVNLSWMEITISIILCLAMIKEDCSRELKKTIATVLMLTVESNQVRVFIMMTYLLWDIGYIKKHVNKHRLWVPLFLMIVSQKVIGDLSGSLIILSLAMYLLICALEKKIKNKDSSLFFIIISMASYSNIEIMNKYLWLSLISFFFIIPTFINHLRIYLNNKDNSYNNSYPVLLLFSIPALLIGSHDIFSLYILSITVIKLIYNSNFVSRDNLLWSVVPLVFVFSPPFGIGYSYKIIMIEKIVEAEAWFALLYIPVLVMLQLAFMKSIFLQVKKNYKEIKNKSYKYDVFAILILIIMFMMSLLFIPRSWTNDYGEIFSKISNYHPPEVSLNFGYIVFWVEALMLSLCYLAYKMIGKEWTEKIYTNLISDRSSIIVVDTDRPSVKIMSKDPQITLRHLISVLDNKALSINVSTQQMIIVFILILLVVSML